MRNERICQPNFNSTLGGTSYNNETQQLLPYVDQDTDPFLWTVRHGRPLQQWSKLFIFKSAQLLYLLETCIT